MLSETQRDAVDNALLTLELGQERLKDARHTMLVLLRAALEEDERADRS